MIMRVRQGKVCESALRHRVRNLRAKVRLLLPIQVCCKHQKRTKNIQKMMQDRGQGQQWYTPLCSNRQKHLFEKLSKAELQQIKQDKLYYVGEQFIDHFDHFLQGKKTSSNLPCTAIPHSRSTPLIKTSGGSRTHKISGSNFSELGNDKENMIKKKVKNMLRYENLRQKRKLLAEHQSAKKSLIKQKIRQRQNRRAQNQDRFIAHRQRWFQQKHQAQILRTSKSMRIKQNRQEAGQIASLSQKLRQLCLQRTFKTQN